jgi:hypothetical protein
MSVRRPPVARTAALVPYTNEQEILSYYDDIESEFQKKYSEEISDEYIDHINQTLHELEIKLARTSRTRLSSSVPVQVECEAFIVEWETSASCIQITKLDIRPCLLGHKLVEHILWRFIKALKGGWRGLKLEGNFELYVQQVLSWCLGKFSSYGADYTYDSSQIKRIRLSDLNLEDWDERDMTTEQLPLASSLKNQEFVDDSERQYNEQFQTYMTEKRRKSSSSSAKRSAAMKRTKQEW